MPKRPAARPYKRSTSGLYLPSRFSRPGRPKFTKKWLDNVKLDELALQADASSSCAFCGECFSIDPGIQWVTNFDCFPTEVSVRVEPTGDWTGCAECSDPNEYSSVSFHVTYHGQWADSGTGHATDDYYTTLSSDGNITDKTTHTICEDVGSHCVHCNAYLISGGCGIAFHAWDDTGCNATAIYDITFGCTCG